MFLVLVMPVRVSIYQLRHIAPAASGKKDAFICQEDRIFRYITAEPPERGAGSGVVDGEQNYVVGQVLWCEGLVQCS